MDDTEVRVKVEQPDSNEEEGTNDDEDEPRIDVESEEDTTTADDEENVILRLGPAILGLQRVGAAPTTNNSSKALALKRSAGPPPPLLNARGMPVRIRKKNRFFYDDDIVNTPHHRQPSAKKAKSTPMKKYSRSSLHLTTPQSNQRITKPPTLSRRELFRSKAIRTAPVTPTQPPPPSASLPPSALIQSPDRKIGQQIGLRLRNVLKLPKAHKWVCYEWFYSNVDRCLFAGDNDFTICLKESFPQLRTRQLTRIQWSKIRKMMGKPRRCSQAFFNEERLELERKRNKIRALQQRKAIDLSSFKDLPPEVPMQLVIGTKVTARLRKPQDGLFTGSIDAVDTSNNTYRITFERHGLGTHSVPDYEVLSNEPPDTIFQSAFTSKLLRHHHRSVVAHSSFSPLKQQQDDPMVSGGSTLVHGTETTPPTDGLLGGFPIKLLYKIILLTKVLTVKKSRVDELSHMNTKAEKFRSFDETLPDEFERHYAAILIDLERLNCDLQLYLDEIQALCMVMAPEPSVAAMLAPSHLREKCRERATAIVRKQNRAVAVGGKTPVKNAAILELVTDLTALLLQVQSLALSDQNAYELQVLQGTMEQIKVRLTTANQIVFQKSVEIHMKHIQMDLGQSVDKIVINGVAKI